VVARGTAAAAADLSAYIGGKTGTSEDENDACFAGFTNDITVVVWVGYDNAGGTRRTLGGGSTGAGVALPIFETIIKAAWANGVPKAPLAPPSPEARKLIVDLPVELNSGERIRGGRSAFIEHFRLDAKGALIEPKNRMVESERNAARVRYARDEERSTRSARDEQRSPRHARREGKSTRHASSEERSIRHAHAEVVAPGQLKKRFGGVPGYTSGYPPASRLEYRYGFWGYPSTDGGYGTYRW